MKWFWPASMAVILTALVLSSCWAIAKIEDPLPGPEVRKLVHPLIGDPHWLVIVKGYQFGKTGNYVAFTAHREPEPRGDLLLFYTAADGKKILVRGDWIVQEQ